MFNYPRLAYTLCKNIGLGCTELACNYYRKQVQYSPNQCYYTKLIHNEDLLFFQAFGLHKFLFTVTFSKQIYQVIKTSLENVLSQIYPYLNLLTQF